MGLRTRSQPVNHGEMVAAIVQAEEIVDEALPRLHRNDVPDSDRLTLRSMAFSHVLHELLTYESE